MTQFRLDIPKLNDNIYEYKNYKRACTEDINSIYNSFEEIDAIWIDSNTQTFVDRTQKDENALNEYFNYLDEMYNEIYKFKNDIAKMLDHEGYPGNSSVLQYNSTIIPACKNDLQTVVSCLNEAISCLQQIADFGYYSVPLASAVMSNISALKPKIQELIQDINYVVGSIDNALATSRSSVARIDKVELKLEPTEYSWRMVDAELTKYTVDEALDGVEKYNSVTANKASMEDMKVTDVSGGVKTYEGASANITTEGQDIVEGLDSGVKQYAPSTTEITAEEQDKVEGLDSGVRQYAPSTTNITTEEQDKVVGLDSGVRQYAPSTTNITTEEQDKVAGLGSGAKQYAPNTTNIKIEEQNRVGNLDSGIESRKSSGNTIKMDNQRKTSIESEAKKEGNKASIDIETSRVNLGEVKSYESAGQKTIDDGMSKSSSIDLGAGVKQYDPNESIKMDDSLMRSSQVDLNTTPFDADSLFRITQE